MDLGILVWPGSANWRQELDGEKKELSLWKTLQPTLDIPLFWERSERCKSCSAILDRKDACYERRMAPLWKTRISDPVATKEPQHPFLMAAGLASIWMNHMMFELFWELMHRLSLMNTFTHTHTRSGWGPDMFLLACCIILYIVATFYPFRCPTSCFRAPLFLLTHIPCVRA